MLVTPTQKVRTRQFDIRVTLICKKKEETKRNENVTDRITDDVPYTSNKQKNVTCLTVYKRKN